MAQGRKLSRAERHRQQKAREDKRFRTMLEDIARSFSCSTEIAQDFVEQCELNRDNLEADLAFSDLALEVWRGRPGVEDLIAVLEELRTTRQRHLDAMAAFVARFHQLAARDLHVHLDSDIINADLVHRRIYPDPPAST